MLFNSLNFAIFLPIVFIIYWAVGNKNIRSQNIVLLLASYFFYGFWDPRFLVLIFLSSLVDYAAALGIENTRSQFTKRIYFYTSIIWNLGVLFVFKYYNFFLANLADLLSIDPSSSYYYSFKIILPVGLSFYTFQTMSYTLDVYLKKITPTKKLLEFLCFVSFFPQLVAGPIERASHLIPQFIEKRKFSYSLAKEGLRQILWGLFKKMVVADNLAIAVNTIFDQPQNYQSFELAYAAVLFYFQIYADFSGYADIAIGTAKLFGFNLSINFNLPHFAKNIPEFWQRWNITLGRWFRDYIYFPFLRNKKKNILNISLGLALTFLLIGIWHGADWTFIWFGGLHALLMILYRLKVFYQKKYKLKKKFIPSIIKMGITISLVIFTVIFFRAANISTALEIVQRIFSFIPDANSDSIIGPNVLFLPFMLILEWFTRKKEYPFLRLEEIVPSVTRWIIYYIFIYFIVRYGAPKQAFIYFQF